VLLGQNGSGKSTIIKVLSGYHLPDPGAEVYVGGDRLQFGSSATPTKLGLRFVHQDSVWSRLPASSTTSSSPLNTRLPPARFGGTLPAIESAARSSRRIGTQSRCPGLDPRAAERTGVAVARALMSEGPRPHVLVLDEPTATLPVNEVNRLLATLRATAATGVGIV